MSTSPDDAQRELERRALRNVRGLVDKIEAGESAERRTQGILLVTIIVIAIVVAGAIAVGLYQHSAKVKPVVLDPAKLPPIRPGPPK
ncbi:MAG: hypothetical protein ACXWAC_05340 [Usitatibacter sp.]